jgi:calcineurin-like phosphoesterase family protein
MNEWMVYSHNRVVKPKDKVYFLGDVTTSRSAESLEILARMNGEKVLIKGNHDQHKAAQYLKYFKDIRGVDPHISGFVLSHVPLHPDCLTRWGTNIHGHLHSNVILLDNKPDPRYVSACMEQIDYTPISLEEIKAKVR